MTVKRVCRCPECGSFAIEDVVDRGIKRFFCTQKGDKPCSMAFIKEWYGPEQTALTGEQISILKKVKEETKQLLEVA